MIIGKEKSSDGGERRKNIRHIRLVDDSTRLSLVSFLQTIILTNYSKDEWFSSKTIFNNIPDDLINTPLYMIYEIIQARYDDERSIRTTTMKYLGMLVREAVYYSETEFFECIEGDVRTFRRRS